MKVINQPGFHVNSNLGTLGVRLDPVLDEGGIGGDWTYNELLLTALTCRLARLPLKLVIQGSAVDVELVYRGRHTVDGDVIDIELITPTLPAGQRHVAASWELMLNSVDTDIQSAFLLDALEILRATSGTLIGQALPLPFDTNTPDVAKPGVGDPLFCQDNQNYYLSVEASEGGVVSNPTFHDFGNSLSIAKINLKRMMQAIWTPESWYNMGLAGDRGLEPVWNEYPFGKLGMPSTQSISLKLMYQLVTSQTATEAIQLTSMSAAIFLWRGANQLGAIRASSVAGGEAQVDLTPVLNAVATLAEQVQGISSRLETVEGKATQVKDDTTEILNDIAGLEEASQGLADRSDVVYTGVQVITAIVTRLYTRNPKKAAKLMRNLADEYLGNTEPSDSSHIGDVVDGPFRLYQDLVQANGDITGPGVNLKQKD